MTKWLTLFILASVLFGQGQSVDGNWTGAITPGTRSLRFEVHLVGAGGTWVSVDQGATIPVKSVQLTGRAVTVGLGTATFEGTLSDSNDEIKGLFQQGGAEIPLTLKRFAGDFKVLTRPQDPVHPFPYTEADITVNGGGGFILAGTLTMPKSGGPFPAALLISGSGPQDRDEALMGHRPFLVLSDSLTRAGFAVLRLDDRGTGKSTGNFTKATYADKVADVQAAVQYLKGRSEVDGKRIGVIGHSEGASIGPLAATESRDIAFVVMMAGMGISGPQVLKQQGIDLIRATGGTEEQVARQVEVQSKLFAIYRESKSPDEAHKRVRDLTGDDATAALLAKQMDSPTFRELLAFDPGPILRKLSCPVLALNGSLDTQVSAKQTSPLLRPRWRPAIPKIGNWPNFRG